MKQDPRLHPWVLLKLKASVSRSAREAHWPTTTNAALYQFFLPELRVPTLTGTLLSGAERRAEMGHASIPSHTYGNSMSMQLSELAISCKKKWWWSWFLHAAAAKVCSWNQRQKHAKMASESSVASAPVIIHLQSIFSPIDFRSSPHKESERCSLNVAAFDN